MHSTGQNLHICILLCDTRNQPYSLIDRSFMSSISLTVFGVSVTNLNEPPRALAISTIAWVRRSSPPLLGRCKQKQRGLRRSLCRWPSITEWEVHIIAQAPPPWNDSEMTYMNTVSSGTLNSSIPLCCGEHLTKTRKYFKIHSFWWNLEIIFQKVPNFKEKISRKMGVAYSSAVTLVMTYETTALTTSVLPHPPLPDITTTGWWAINWAALSWSASWRTFANNSLHAQTREHLKHGLTLQLPPQ